MYCTKFDEPLDTYMERFESSECSIAPRISIDLSRNGMFRTSTSRWVVPAMFFTAKNFNQHNPLEKWNVHKVQSMHGVRTCSWRHPILINQPLQECYVLNVEDSDSMFDYAINKFNLKKLHIGNTKNKHEPHVQWGNGHSIKIYVTGRRNINLPTRTQKK